MDKLLIGQANIICFITKDDRYIVDMVNKRIDKCGTRMPYINYIFYDLLKDDEIEDKRNQILSDIAGGLKNYLIYPIPKDSNILIEKNLKVIRFNSLHEYFNLSEDTTQKEIERSLRNAISSKTLTRWLYKNKSRSSFIESKINNLEEYKSKVNNIITGDYEALYHGVNSMRMIIYSKYLSLRESTNNSWYGYLIINTYRTEGHLEKNILAKDNYSFEECLNCFKECISEIQTTLNKIKINQNPFLSGSIEESNKK